jgi:hypothetical protein
MRTLLLGVVLAEAGGATLPEIHDRARGGWSRRDADDFDPGTYGNGGWRHADVERLAREGWPGRRARANR